MSAILRWFHDGDVRYRAYFRTPESAPAMRELIIASAYGQAADLVAGNVTLEDLSDTDLLGYARRVRVEAQVHAEATPTDAAAD